MRVTKRTNMKPPVLSPRQLPTMDKSPIQNQNAMRLRVNRVALIQELKYEHIIKYLIQNDVLDEEDKKKIEKGSTAGDKTRIMIDILPTKPKETEWYKHFRQALKTPEAGLQYKKKYNILVEFLDNTIIASANSPIKAPEKKPNSGDKMKLPHFNPLPSIQTPMCNGQATRSGNVQSRSMSEASGNQNSRSRVSFNIGITPSEEEPLMFSMPNDMPAGDEKGMRESVGSGFDKSSQGDSPRKTLVKGFYHRWLPTPENFKSLIEIPEEHFKQLEKGSNGDKHQLENEYQVLKKVQNLEIVFALERRNQLPEGFSICMCSAVEDILNDTKNFHLYVKYFNHFKSRAYMDILKEISTEFCQFVQQLPSAEEEETRNHISEMAFNLVDLLTEYGYYNTCESVITSLIEFLASNPNIETWMVTYHAYMHLMSIRNRNFEFTMAEHALNVVQRYVTQIELMSFGQDLLDQGEEFLETSVLLREQGSVNPAFNWANKAMQEVEEDNEETIMNTLFNATQAYCAKWNTKKAEELAIHTVQQAKSMYGTNHPLYVKALLTYCHFSNEFRQDNFGVEVAQEALSISEKLYQGSSVFTAHCHRVLATALMAAGDYHNHKFHEHAFQALRVAMDVLPASHLAIFKQTLARGLQCKAELVEQAERHGLLLEAESLARQAQNLISSHYGDISIKSAQAYILQGTVKTKMGDEEGEVLMKQGLQMLQICTSPQSNYQLIMKGTLGTFYKQKDCPLEAINLLTQVVNSVDSNGVYLKWAHTCYDNLIELLKASDRHTEAEEYQAKLIDWMAENPKLANISWEVLNESPKPFKDFLEKFNLFKAKLGKVKASLKKLIKKK
ncbi:unnamed protein product [Owenia fusiformis]|uniref:CARD domain-containing protein n=1 Tax=Owenia fusiformis TaxID=6347 RepID=A0A8S4N315_OWEFU|nr:unnamed protein product [Owenia fusiformis]